MKAHLTDSRIWTTLGNAKSRNTLLWPMLAMATASAQVEIVFDPFTVDSGAATSSGSTFSISGTTGQPDAGRMSGGNYVIRGGFWHAYAASKAPAGIYAAWARDMGLVGSNTALNRDPDFDGISNLMEFYFGGNPLVGDPAILPASKQEDGYFILRFLRRDGAELELAQSVEFSGNLSAWTASAIGPVSSNADHNGVIVTVSENDANPDEVTVKIPLTLAEAGKLFVRLLVTE